MSVLLTCSAARPGAAAQIAHASAQQPSFSDTDTTVFARRGCKFGQRYSSYHRRCVLWMPFDYT